MSSAPLLDRIDQIPFKNAKIAEKLRTLDIDLGGLEIDYCPPSEYSSRHYMGLNIEAKQGGILCSMGGAYAECPDNAAKQILRQIENYCVHSGYPLVVDAHGSGNGRRVFTVLGDAENGFAFRKSPEPKPKSSPYNR
jgi:hypothetical protein